LDKIKVLFLAANPGSSKRSQLDVEIREITSKIRSADYHDSIYLVSSWAVRPDDLLQLLNQHKPDIVHFSGERSSVRGITLFDDDGDSRPLSNEAIKALFAAMKDNIKIVFLNACYSRQQAEAITSVIDCAIGMDEAVDNRSAIIFASAFYRAIGFGRSIRDAFEQGKVALLLEGLPNENLPELLVRKSIDPSSICLLEVDHPEIPKKPLGDSRTTIKKKIINVPQLQPTYIPRYEDLESIKQLIFSSGKNKTVITGAAKSVGVQGMGGIGKSVLAAAVGRDPEIGECFPDGIIWINIGREHKSTKNISQEKKCFLCEKQSELYSALFADTVSFKTVERGRIVLSKLLIDKKCLIILDDVWSIEDFKAFNVLGPNSQILVTTRNSSIINSIGAEEYCVDVLDDEIALKLLATWANQELDNLPIIALSIIKECGNLPLAISIVGAMAKGKDRNYWANILDKLQRASLDEIKYIFPDYPYHDLLRAMEVSLESLQEENINSLDAPIRYLEFAIFPEDVQIPKSVLSVLWKAAGLKEYQIEDLINLFAERSLCRREGNGTISLHDLQLDYVRKRFAGDKPERLMQLHNRLLKSYKKSYPDKWPSLIDDGYFQKNLAYHFLEAGRENELKKMTKEQFGRFLVVGIGGRGGKITQSFLSRPDSSRIDKLMRLIGSDISEDLTGVWLEADKNNAINCQSFFGDLTKGAYPGYFIPHDVIEDGSTLYRSVVEKYGYDIKMQGFDGDAQYLKAIFEIFDTDEMIQRIAESNSEAYTWNNPIFDGAWDAIKGYTTYGGGDCDGILFIVSIGGGTGAGFINPIMNRIRMDGKGFPVFVLGILTEVGDASEIRFLNEGRKSLAAIIAIYDLLTNSDGANGIILVDNQILLERFGNNYEATNKFIRKMMLPMLLGRDYPRETPSSQEIAMRFTGGLPKPSIFVPFYSSQARRRNPEQELVRKSLTDGKLFGCTPEKADLAVVFCRGFIDSAKVRKALSTQIGIDEKKIWVLRKISEGENEILILLRNPYGSCPEAYCKVGTLENRFCKMISLAMEYMNQNKEDLMPRLTYFARDALSQFFFGPEGFVKDNFGKTSGLAFELREARRRLRKGERPFFRNPLRIYSKKNEPIERKSTSYRQ
jgi:hypothetical protein